MPPKKSRAKKPKTTVSQRQTAEQRQNINIRIGDLSTKKPRKKRAPRAPRAPIQPMVNLPPVVYQIPAMSTSYGGSPEPAPRTIADAMPKRTTIADPIPRATSIAGYIPRATSIAGSIPDDAVSISSSEIIDIPDRSETLSQLGDLVSVESPDDADMASLPRLYSTEEEDRMMRANIFASPQQSFGLLSPSEVSGNLRGSRGDPEDFFTQPVQPPQPMSSVSDEEEIKRKAFAGLKTQLKKDKRQRKRREKAAAKREREAMERGEAQAKSTVVEVPAATAMSEVITESAPVVKKSKGGRPAGRPNRTQEERRQMEMEKSERKRIQAEAKARKDAAKSEAKKTTGKMNKKLVKIEQQREELSIPPDL